MAKTGAAQIITDVLKRLGYDWTDATPLGPRADALRQLNISNREILTEHSLRFMLLGPTALNIVTSVAAIPATVDPSKTMLLTRTSSGEEIIYKAPDEWGQDGIDTYGNTTQTEPTTYTVVGANFLFHPLALTTTCQYIAQARVTALIDDAASFSQLPEGWEEKLLAIDCEAEMRRQVNEPHWQDLKARAKELREALYASERTSKLVQKTDREQKERKIEQTQLSPEAPS